MVLGFLKGFGENRKAPAEPPSSEPAPSNARSLSHGVKSALTVNEFVARTKRSRERGLEPTKPELIAYARYLGIDPIVDNDLMWIADEALNAPLPSEWTEHHDSADRVFYYNVQTHASSWTHPLEQLHRDTYKCIVNFRSGDLSKEDKKTELEKLRRKCEEAERDAHRELQAWSEHTDEQGSKFYYNREHQRSVWTDPRPARCHALYLQMKALRVLSKQLGQAGVVGGETLQPLAAGAESHRDRLDDIDKEKLLQNLPSNVHHTISSRSKKDLPSLGGADTEGVEPPIDGRFANGTMDEDGRSVAGGDGRKRGRKKKRKDEEGDRRSRREPSAPEEEKRSLSPMASQHAHHGGLPQSLRKASFEEGFGGAEGDMREVRPAVLDRKKPSHADVHVDEVRAAIGLSGGDRFSRNFQGPRNHLPDLASPPGDGLSTVGRARVRPGIQLEPLHV